MIKEPKIPSSYEEGSRLPSGGVAQAGGAVIIKGNFLYV